MKKFKKLIILGIIIICITIICLGLYLNRDYLIRQYFISKIESVEYDEYILTTSVNGKKVEKYYYADDYAAIRMYDNDENLEDFVRIYDFDENILYICDDIEYDILQTNVDIERPIHINNLRLLMYLKESEQENIVQFKGMKKVNDQICYVFLFEIKDKEITTIYLDKDLLYTVRVESLYNTNFEDDYNQQRTNIAEYELDLELREKELFEFNEN